LLRRGFALEYVTLAWNVAGIVVLGIAAVAARSVALAGFGLDSLIVIGPVLHDLPGGSGPLRQGTADLSHLRGRQPGTRPSSLDGYEAATCVDNPSLAI
jgi:hypothetical protein